MQYDAFEEQSAFHRSCKRIRGVFAGKRGGKTECGAIESILFTDEQRNYDSSGIDPYIGVIIAPTSDMLRRLSIAKLLGYAEPFNYSYHKSFQEITWPNGSKIYGISADKPQRLEGIKAHWIWIDEVFQVSEQLFLEAMARTADTQGYIWCTGSLGVQYNNPKAHWVYRHFKKSQDEETEIFEWPTAQNPYFPRNELYRLKDTLDPRTYRAMFELSWDMPSTNAIFNQFDEMNIIPHYKWDPSLETSVSIDWGWAHEMAALFFQHDKKKNIVYCFDEIVSSRLTLEELYKRIISKPYKINNWYADVAGNQERESTGWSNIRWFAESPRNIKIKTRQSKVALSISLVRQWIRNGKGQARFFVSESCPKTIDGMRNYRYVEKSGMITEDPLKQDDDCVDAVRYYFWNRHDPDHNKPKIVEFDRWGTWQ
jgi:phage terminase large subunit